MSSRLVELAPGGTLAGFKIEAVLGRGGMATVYRAEQVSLRRQVALKVLSVSLSADPEFRERFRREGQIIAALEHPNIVTVYDSGESEGQLYFAMRLIEGENLAERLRTSGLSAAGVIRTLAPIASALDAAHASGLVHRDVKPENLLLNREGVPFLADFGIARGGDAGLTSTGMFVGSISYASPEHILGSQLTTAADVYALAVVAYQCLAGQVPFKADSEVGVMRAHLEQAPPAVPNLPPLAAELNAVLARGMAKEPADRYPTAGEFLRDIELAVQKLSREYLEGIPAFSVATLDAQVDELHTQTVRRERDQGALAEPSRTAPEQVSVAPESHFPQYTASGAAAAEATSGAQAAQEPDIDAPDHVGAATDPPSVTDQPFGTHGDVSVGAADRKPRRRATVVWGVLVALAAVAAIAALSVGGSGSASIKSARAGAVTVIYSPPWAPANGSDAVLAAPSIRLTDGSSAVEIGPLQQSAEVPAGAPPALIRSHGAPSGQAAATVAGHEATAYAWGNSPLAVVLATTAGDYAVICTGPGASANCCHFSRKTSLSGLTFLAPGTDQAVQSQLASAVSIARLGSAQRKTLAEASLSARAATLLVAADHTRSAAMSAERIPTPARFNASIHQLGAALTEEGAVLRSLAHAARDNSPAAFNARRTRLRAAKRAVQASLALLGRYGFHLGYAPLAVAAATILPASSAAKPGTAGPTVVQRVSTASPAPAPSSSSSSSSSSSQIIIQGGAS